jgi:hypothetical protein
VGERRKEKMVRGGGGQVSAGGGGQVWDVRYVGEFGEEQLGRNRSGGDGIEKDLVGGGSAYADKEKRADSWRQKLKGPR